jgi:hypothetical protein
MRYVIECPADHPEYALDTVTSGEADEFSQEYIGEKIVSSRVISEKDALALCDKDNGYKGKWTEAKMIACNFTTIEDLT